MKIGILTSFLWSAAEIAPTDEHASHRRTSEVVLSMVESFQSVFACRVAAAEFKGYE